jgi:hypothetical protein
MGPLANGALCLSTIVNPALALSVRYKFPDFRRQYNLAVTIQLQRKYFNPQGWETFGEALREANVPQDLIGHEDRWRYITQTKRTPD